MLIVTFWIVLSGSCFVGVQSRSWTAIVDSSIYESSNKDIARVLNATESELFPLQTAMPSIIPSPQEQPSQPVPTTIPLDVTTKQPNQLPTLKPSYYNASSNLPTRVPQLAPSGWNTTEAPTMRSGNVAGNGGCNESASLYRIVLYDNAGDAPVNTTISISGLTSSTRIVSQREPRSSFDEATSQPTTSHNTGVLHRSRIANIFGRSSPESRISSNDLENFTIVDVRNITVGVSKRHIVGNFTFQSLNSTGSKDFQYVCLEPQVCYDVLVQGGSERIVWAVQPVELGVSTPRFQDSSSVAVGYGEQGYRCGFHIPDTNGSLLSCQNSCNATLQVNSTSADASIRPTSPSASDTPSFQPSRTFLPSQTLFPTYLESGLTEQPSGSLTQLPSQTMYPTSIAMSLTEQPSQSPSQLVANHDLTSSPTRRRHLTHHPTDATEVGPPVEVKTPFPTNPGE